MAGAPNPAFAHLGPDRIASPVHLYVDIQIDDARLDDANVVDVVGTAAAQLGDLEDGEIIMGAQVGGPLPAGTGQVLRNPALWQHRAQLNATVGLAFTQIPGGPAGGGPRGWPTGAELLDAIDDGMLSLNGVHRPGPCGLLLYTRLHTILGSAPVPGGAPFMQQVEERIMSSEIAATLALSGQRVPGETAAVLFRLRPPAFDIVYTMRPTLTFLGRNAGLTSLRIEEELVVRIRDQAAIHHLVY
jgi:hypothetical protein